MARDSNHPGNGFETEDTGGLLSGFLAEEEDFDRRSLWRIGSWGVGTVAAVVIAVLANQSAFKLHLDQVAADDLARQAQQLRTVAKESQNEARRLASAVDTLNSDRDRLYARVTVLEQGLDSVTGSIARQGSAANPVSTEPQSASQNSPAPVATPVATTAAATVENPGVNAAITDAGPATVASAGQANSAEPDATPPDTVTAAPMPDAVAAVQPEDNHALDNLAVQRTEFAVDVGTASSLNGLRALWRSLLKSNAELTPLRPVIAIRENGNGRGVQLRLVAGPLHDAAAAAKICAALTEGKNTCETTLFDGQRLVMRSDAPAASVPVKPVASTRKHSAAKHPPSAETPKKPEASTLSSLFTRR